MCRQYLNKILKLSSFSNFVLQKFKFFQNDSFTSICKHMKKLQTFLCFFGKRYAILTPLFKQPEIRPVCNIARTAHTFLSLPTLGGWWLD
jgi:hypothetical protein